MNSTSLKNIERILFFNCIEKKSEESKKEKNAIVHKKKDFDANLLNWLYFSLNIFWVDNIIEKQCKQYNKPSKRIIKHRIASDNITHKIERKKYFIIKLNLHLQIQTMLTSIRKYSINIKVNQNVYLLEFIL